MDYKNIADELSQEYEERRLKNYALFQQKQREVCEKCPGLEELLAKRHALVLSGIRSGILHREGSNVTVDAAAEMKEINASIQKLLKKAALPEDALKPVYTCPICKDEGFYYNPSRTMCECYRKALSEKLLLQAVHPEHCFENYDATVFSDAQIQNDITQRQLMNRNRIYCEEYAQAYPENPLKNLLLIGKSGLGKTYLLECIAHRLAQRGYMPVCTTAYKLFEDMRKAFFENDTDRLQQLMLPKILLLDDFGSEPLVNNVTVELFFTLLDMRLRENMHTVISTNFNQNELRTKYTERISSRLLDTSSFQVLRFAGEDVRKNLKGKNPA